MTHSTTDGIVALTGATGFVGGHALSALLAKGWRVRVLARDPSRLDLPARWRERVEVLTGALEDAEALTRLAEGARSVLHVAGAVRAVRDADFFRVNAEAAARLAAKAVRAGVRRFVLVSSLAAREPQLSAYAASKRRAEELVRAVVSDSGAKTRLVIVRPPAVYGPGDAATFPLFDQLTRRVAVLPGRVDQRVSLIHVADLAEALVTLCTTDVRTEDPLEIDDGHAGGYAWADIAGIAARVTRRRTRVIHLPQELVAAASHASRFAGRLLGRPSILSPGKVRELYHPDWVARSPSVVECADWTARLQFAEGFRDTLAWYVRQGWLPATRLPAAPGERSAESRKGTSSR